MGEGGRKKVREGEGEREGKREAGNALLPCVFASLHLNDHFLRVLQVNGKPSCPASSSGRCDDRRRRRVVVRETGSPPTSLPQRSRPEGEDPTQRWQVKVRTAEYYIQAITLITRSCPM